MLILHEEMIEKLRANPLSLIHSLDTKDVKELHKVIILLITVMDGMQKYLLAFANHFTEEFKLEFQKKGGFTNLCKALSLPALAHNTDVLTHLLVTVITFVTAGMYKVRAGWCSLYQNKTEAHSENLEVSFALCLI